jgi:hypothetical protein
VPFSARQPSGTLSVLYPRQSFNEAPSNKERHSDDAIADCGLRIADSIGDWRIDNARANIAARATNLMLADYSIFRACGVAKFATFETGRTAQGLDFLPKGHWPFPCLISQA